jgi:hypothetical protein
MNRFGWLILLFISSIYVTGCATSEFNETTLYKEESNNGYCHKVFQPVGPTDLIRPTQSRAGDYISYSGPCDGATAAELARKQRRFEQFRFGRDFMPG